MSQTRNHDLESNDAPSGLWGSRTLTEKISLPVIVILVILSITLLVIIIVTPSTASKKEPEVCSTPGCVQAANYLLNSMNASVDPCTDFFEFACGLWKEQNPIPDGQNSISAMDLISTLIAKQLDVLLSKNVTSKSKSINMARIFHKTCLNSARIEELKSRTILEAMNALGKWPILETEWYSNSFKLTDFLVTSIQDTGYSPFFRIIVDNDDDNDSRKILHISQKRTRLDRYLLDPAKYSKKVGMYRNYLRQLVQFVKADMNLTKSDDKINQDIDKVIAFETEIAKIHVVTEIDRRDGTRKNKNFKRCKMQDLYKVIPQVDWVDYLRRIVPSDLNYPFNNETEIIIMEMDYLKKLSKLLESTNASVVVNYVIYKIVDFRAEDLDNRFTSARRVFYNSQADPRDSYCYEKVGMKLPLPTGVIYAEEHFRESDKQEALDMVLDLKKSFLEMIQQNDWIDEETRTEAIAKLNSMTQSIGYDDEIKDFKKLDERYEWVEIKQGDSFLKCLIAFEVAEAKRSFKQLVDKDIIKVEALVPVAVVGGSYDPDMNRISFPAGMLQPPYFSGISPKCINYGGIGAVIGHEMTHGFDDRGSQYDKDGKMRNWWSNSSRAIFEKKTNCIVEQYNGYTVPGTTQKLNGEISQGENIADNGGLKVAFRAYQRYVKEHGEEPRLPGLQQYTNEQLFFLGYGSAFCEQYTVERIINQAQLPHPPTIFRINAPLSNMKEFADAYNCPKNSPINPDNKCIVW